jgi:DNA-binding LacI/PurR family transcriptional regulator
VAQIALRLGYRPSARARALASGKELAPRVVLVNLGFMPEGVVQSSYAPVLPGVMTRAAELGVQVQVETVRPGVSSADALRHLAAEDRADGVIVLTFHPLVPADVQPLADAGLPFVLVNRHFGHIPGAPAVHQVVPDWAGMARDAVERFAALGRRQMVALFSGGETSTLLDREQGWREGVARCGLDPALAPVVRYPIAGRGDIDNAQGYAFGKQLLTAGLPVSDDDGAGGSARGVVPTAILAFNDSCAHGVLRAARELGVSVPEQLSVIGTDDSVARFTYPALCSYNPEFHQLGVHAVELLGAQLRRDPRATGPQQVTVPARFVCRESCGPVPAGTAR